MSIVKFLKEQLEAKNQPTASFKFVKAKELIPLEEKIKNATGAEKEMLMHEKFMRDLGRDEY